jgi:GR25 family glycosyltransferase involved in LPS biosynthesis
MIDNNYYYFLDNNINFFTYLFLYSIITIQKPINLFIYINKKIDDKYYNKLSNKSLWIDYKTNIIFKELNNNFEQILFEDLKKYGGIYVKDEILFLKNMKNFLIHDYIKLENKFYGLKKNNNIQNFEELYNLKDIFTLNDNTYYQINELIKYNKIITDYNFTLYFNIIYNHYMININIDYDESIYNNLENNKITIFNLVIYYILGYSYYFSEETDSYQNFDKINEIGKIYYINLENSKLRNDSMINILNNIEIEYERHDAFDGRKIKNIKNNYYEDKELNNVNTNSEYAVLYSHLSLIDKLQYIDGEYFLIFEDDLSLDFQKYWNQSIKNIINDAPEDWEIIMLGYFTLNVKFDTNYREWNNDWSALSYIIKKSSIKKINEYKINNKFKLFNDVNVADNYIFRIFKTYVYKYPLFTINNNNKSTFHNDHEHYQKIYKNINLLILNNTLDNYI